MPKSRNRGGNKLHKKKSQQRTEMLKRKTDKMRKEFIEQMQKAQQESMKKEEANIIDADELGDIGEDFKIDGEDEIGEDEIGEDEIGDIDDIKNIEETK